MRHQYGIAELSTDTAPDWRTRAACIGYDPEMFHSLVKADRRAAKRVCRQCPVQTECLTWALQVGDDWAVLGCTEPKQRRKMREPVQREDRCRVCGDRFTTARSSGRIYCSAKCNKRALRRRQAQRAGDAERQRLRWTEVEVDQLRDMVAVGHDDMAIAARMGRNPRGVRNKRQQLRLRRGQEVPL